MADLRKEQERDEIHRAIWAISDELRGINRKLPRNKECIIMTLKMSSHMA